MPQFTRDCPPNRGKTNYRINVWIAARTDGSGTTSDLNMSATCVFKFHGTWPSGNAEGAPVWSEYWRCRHIAVERNTIELARTLEGSGAASGIPLSGNQSNNPALYPLTFRRYLARENIIRHFLGSSDERRVDGLITNKCKEGRCSA